MSRAYARAPGRCSAKAVVTTIPRALAAMAVAAIFLLGVPSPPFSTALAAAGSQPAHGVASASDNTQAVASNRRDPMAVPLALPATNNGDQRLLVRDLPQEHSSSHALLPDIGAPWGVAPLPESVKAPDFAEPFALPLGRAPPLTARV
ncbi:hypothetical protein [Allosalinactinospora lopnorensis]|uniref:hypothetical protein n=1 Tax=Allosalinactinospora lopnorensis TaxID=1352348 RepID=UPI000623D4F2|nr:hypothetical protein [Allosalinactinospora lopnorensis]